MTRYAVPPNTNRKAFRVWASGSIGLMLLFLILSRLDLSDRVGILLGWSGIGILFLGLLSVLVLIYRESFAKLWEKTTFDLNDETIVRTMDGKPNLEFSLSKISFLGKSSLGLIVRSGEPSKGFLIPRGVNDFEQLKQRLSEHCTITPSSR